MNAPKTQRRQISVEEIDTSDRLRLVCEEAALAIAASISENGLINPITIRHTPNGATKWKLVAGAHRLRALTVGGIHTLFEGEHFKVVRADAEIARLIEAEENFARKLTWLDQALTFEGYRTAWMAKYGPTHGGDRRSDQFRTRADLKFSEWVIEKLGFSPDKCERLTKIAKGISGELRILLRGTPEADNQTLLLKIAKYPPERRHEITVAYRDHRDMEKAISITDPNVKAKATEKPQQKYLDRLTGTWQRTDRTTRTTFLGHIVENQGDRRETLRELRRMYPDDYVAALHDEPVAEAE